MLLLSRVLALIVLGASCAAAPPEDLAKKATVRLNLSDETVAQIKAALDSRSTVRLTLRGVSVSQTKEAGGIRVFLNNPKAEGVGDAGFAGAIEPSSGDPKSETFLMDISSALAKGRIRDLKTLDVTLTAVPANLRFRVDGVEVTVPIKK